MGELTIRRNKGFAVPQYREAGRTEKTAGSASSQKTARTPDVTVSETMRQRMTPASQTEGLAREGRRTLQAGEAALAEVRDSLGRMAELAREAAGREAPDRATLQAELEHLREEIDRVLSSAGGSIRLFQEGDSKSETEALPDWLIKGITVGIPSAERLLAALGLDKSADAQALLTAIANCSLESNSAAGYLAALCLGAVISSGTLSEGAADPTKALDGLRQLLEQVSKGVPPDQAVRALTNGEFTSLADFQERFTAGTIPGLQMFLSDLLLSGSSLPDGGMDGSSLLTFFLGIEGADLDILMTLLTSASQSTGREVLPELAAADGLVPDNNMPASGPAQAAEAPVSTVRFGNIQAAGRDLSGLSVNEATGELTVGGTADVILRGVGQTAQAVRITGSGTVTLQEMNISTLTVDTAEARIFSVGRSVLKEVYLLGDAVPTFSGSGLLRIGTLHAGSAHAALRLTGGAVTVQEKEGEALGVLPVPVLLDGPVSLAAQADSIRTFGGKSLEPFDVLWKTLLPGFHAVTSVEIDGRQAKLHLLGGSHPDAARLWMEKGDLSSHGYPAHALVIRGRDGSGHLRTRYAYLHWNRRAGGFEEFSMYPNPFTVTGGEPGQDWAYEEASHTLCILSSQVSAISGGAGVDAGQSPFSGRIVLADHIGSLALTLDGVVCRVSSGSAFRLGCGNEVTLILPRGTSSLFESGTGCAGISLGDGTTLRIDCDSSGGMTAGTLTATGGAGCEGIGRDKCGGSPARTGPVLIRGGMLTGSEKRDAAGSVTIIGDAATGERGESSDLGSAKVWIRMGLFLQLGEDTVILPRFPLSSRVLRLDRLQVSTKEDAQTARVVLDAGQRWVSQLQTAYRALSSRLEQGGLSAGPVRDTATAGTLLDDVRQSIPLPASQAMRTHARPGTEDVGQLLQS